MRPVIGVLLRPIISESGRKMDGIYESIKVAILEKGGIPLGIPFYLEEELSEKDKTSIEKVLHLCDGILLQGGDDFYPLDLFVAEYAYKKDIPLLGICLGMQTISCFKDGVMKDLDHPEFHLQKNVENVHSVKIDRTSHFYSMMKEENISVNSRHKSYIESTNLDKIGYAEDGTLEIVEDKTKTFFMGVQWHPEDMISYDRVSNLLFNSFIKACKG